MTSDQIPHVLAFDVGNSSIHFAHVHGDEIHDVRQFRLGELAGMSGSIWRLWEQIPTPRVLAACSVNKAGLNALEAAAAETVDEGIKVVGRDLPLPMPTELDEPGSCGTDRLCAAVAAYDRLGQACVIGDFGTAITIDCVNGEGVFLGGAILPGLGMQAQALHEHTDQIPRVDIAAPDWVFGRNTRQAVQSGIVRGARGALRDLVEAYATEMKQWPTVLLTGADAKLICEFPGESDLVQTIVPDLTIRGVAMAYYNALLDRK
jgi:type III pantothenate kinase